MNRQLKQGLLMMVTVGLILTANFSLPAQFQGQQPGKISNGRSVQRKQEEGQPSPDVIGYWNSLRIRSKEARAVSWNKRSGTPRAIFGKISTPVKGASELAARSFLVENSRLFKMRGDTGDLVLEHSRESLVGLHFVLEQQYEGVPVYGAEVSIHFDHDGEIMTVDNTYEPGIIISSVAPQMSEPNAVARALEALTSKASGDVEGELFILPLDRTFSLAWRIVVPTEGPTWELFVDAANGNVLLGPRDLNRYANGVGQVFNVNAIVATHDNTLRDNADAASAVPATAYSLVTLQGLVGNGFLDGTFASSSKSKKRVFDPSNSFIFDRSNDGLSETMGYYYIDYAERYIQTLGFSNVNNRQQVFSVNRLKVDNSFYSPQSKEITYGLGGVDDAEDAEVILHEYGHSIQDNQVSNFGSSHEAGSMGEGFGDYLGASVGAQFSGGFQDLCLAEWDATSYSSTNPPCLRRLDSTKHYPEDLDGEVHDDGEMWSAPLWQIREAIGATNADRAIIAAHFLLSPTASFNEGANAIVMAARSLGYKNNQVNSIRTILANRGFTVSV